ncbi:MAG: sensor histidine kinase [Spirochaetaceae bacterium]
MAGVSIDRGFVLKCDPAGVVIEIAHDSREHPTDITPGRPWYADVDAESREKADAFFEAVCSNGSAFNHELNINTSGGLGTFRFAGVAVDGQVLIIASKTHNGLTNLVHEFTQIGNEQANMLRSATKENFELRRRMEQDLDNYDEISRLNNELVNLQRTLSKKNSELERLNSIKNRFLGIAAHDLRNPLGNVLLLSELIQEDPEGLSSEQAEFLEQIRWLSRSMLEMVNDLLDVSAIDSGQISIRRERVDLRKLVEKNVSLNRKPAENAGITLTCRTADEEIVSEADTDKIHQVLNNLVSNAIKYSPSGTTVTVDVSAGESGAVVSVADQGPGIPREAADQLFRPFKTAGTVSSGGQKSTGLGLYICRRIVEAHGGRIRLESEPGEGSTFAFELPRYEG